MLKIGEKAPNFSLPDIKGKIVSLNNFIGKKVVIYFYPKDDTPGCTKQACSFRDSYKTYIDNNIVLIGISKDDEKSHKKFIEKYDLPFILLSDTTGETLTLYDVWKQKSMYGKTFMGINRATFVINENGIIIKIFEKANPTTNANDILKFLKVKWWWVMKNFDKFREKIKKDLLKKQKKHAHLTDEEKIKKIKKIVFNSSSKKNNSLEK